MATEQKQTLANTVSLWQNFKSSVCCRVVKCLLQCQSVVWHMIYLLKGNVQAMHAWIAWSICNCSPASRLTLLHWLIRLPVCLDALYRSLANRENSLLNCLLQTSLGRTAISFETFEWQGSIASSISGCCHYELSLIHEQTPTFIREHRNVEDLL